MEPSDDQYEEMQPRNRRERRQLQRARRRHPIAKVVQPGRMVIVRAQGRAL